MDTFNEMDGSGMDVFGQMDGNGMDVFGQMGSLSREGFNEMGGDVMDAFGQMGVIGWEGFNQSSNRQNHTAAVNQPQVANTSLLITDLHRSVTYSALFNAIRNVGKIKYARIHDGAGRRKAATIKFFSHQAALRLLNLAKAGYYRINAAKPPVTWSSDIEGEEESGDRSRGLKITGPQDIVNRISLEKIWDMHLTYSAEKVHESVEGGIGVVEYYFASESTEALLAIDLLFRTFGDTVQVSYLRDPCET